MNIASDDAWMRDVDTTYLIYDRGTTSGIIKIGSRETVLGEGNLYCIIQQISSDQPLGETVGRGA